MGRTYRGVDILLQVPSRPLPLMIKRIRLIGSRALGLLCLIGVILIWVISGELIEFIFTNQSFNSPFFLTYFNTSLFSLYMIGFLIRPKWWNTENGPPLLWLPWLRCCINNSTTTSSSNSIDSSDGNVHHSSPPKHESEDIIDDEDTPVISTTTTTTTGSSTITTNMIDKNIQMMTIRQVAGIALGFCPLWFGANYLYNLSLSMTSVASATILSTTSSLFTFALGCAMKVEQPTIWKLVGLLVMLGGVVLVSLIDTGSQPTSQRDSILGDALAVGGAVFYAFYAVYLKLRLDEKRVHMPMFFGFVGIFNVVLMWPLGVFLHFIGWERLHAISPPTLGFLFANAIIGTVISDYLWVMAVLLVSPVVATAGLSLTIPLSMIADLIVHHQAFNALYIVGAALTAIGFLFVNTNPLEILRPLWRRIRDCCCSNGMGRGSSGGSLTSSSSLSSSSDHIN